MQHSTPTPGHAARSGSGPSGETCGTCAHLFRYSFGIPHIKCGLLWPRKVRPDIRYEDAACRKWQQRR